MKTFITIQNDHPTGLTTNPFHKSILFLSACLLIIFGGCASVGVIKKGDVDSEVIRDVRKTVSVFNEIITEDMHLSLSKEFPIYVAANRGVYERVIYQEFKLPKAEAVEWADNSSGFSSDHGVALDTYQWVMGKSHDHSDTTAHELFHQLQHSLMGNYWKADPRWLREGTTYLVTAHIGERRGYLNLNSWKRSWINDAKTLPDLATVEEVIAANPSQKWLSLSKQKKAPHIVSTLMVLALFDLSKKEPYQSIAEYYRDIGSGKGFNDSFSEAFGLTCDQFKQGFAQWYQDMLDKPADIDITAGPSVDPGTVKEIKETFARTQSFFKEHWGNPMKTDPRIILALNQADSLETLQKEFGFTPAGALQEANEMAFPFYLWNDRAILNISDERVSQEPLAFTTAFLLARIFGNEISARHNMEGATWLYYGTADLTAAMIEGKKESKSLKEQKKLWLQKVRLMAGGRPRLDQVHTVESFRRAAVKAGLTNLRAYIRLATLCLSEKYDLNSLMDWHKQSQELDNVSKAFEKVFGLSLEKFELEFAEYIEQQIKKSE